MQNNDNELKWNLRSWLWVILYSLGIFATVPLSYPINIYVFDRIDDVISVYIILSAIAAAFAALLHTIIFRFKIKTISQYLWLSSAIGAYIYIILRLWSSPAEMIHILEYALLNYLLFRALNCRIQDRTIYFTAALFGMFIGTTDECLQWMMPKRIFDFRDIGLNLLVGIIFQVANWKGIQPRTINKAASRFSINILIGIIIANLVFLLLCFTNTPDVVNRYTSHIMPLSWLRTEEPMIEFGHVHDDAEIGTFYSRLSLEELQNLDYSNSKLNGIILSEDISLNSDYSLFLKIYNPSTNPFLHELRVHLFRRDHHAEISLTSTDPDQRMWSNFIALKENLIIEKYFGNTLRQSKFLWPEEIIKQREKLATSMSKAYRSPVSSGVITTYTLKSVWTIIFVSTAVIWTIGTLWKRRLKT